MKLLASRKKPTDPLTQRAQALNAEIEALQAQIRELGAQLDSTPSPASVPFPSGDLVCDRLPEAQEPVFEQVDHRRVTTQTEPGVTAEHYNELGVRKYDLAGAWRRMQQHFRGPAASNPRLINYLAAGSIQGLRPLRYEKRVARNRVLALAFVLLIVLCGIAATFLRR